MRSVAVKLWTAMISLIVIMLILLWVFQIRFLDKFYTDQHLKRIQQEGVRIVQNIDKLSFEDIKQDVGMLADNYRAKIDIIDSKGNVIYSEGQAPMMHGMFDSSILGAVISGQTVSVPVLHPRFKTEMQIIGLPIDTKLIKGGLFINVPIAPVKDTADILRQQLKYIISILLAAALALSFLLSRAFTKPILDINRAAAQMASGNLDVRLKIKSKDELGRLSATMNYLAEQLTRVEQLRRELIANVSHELRTPLSLIRGYAETIRDISGNNIDKREKHLGIIIEESDRLGKVVDDILNLSQLQSGYASINIAKFRLDSMFERISKTYDITCEISGTTLSVESQAELVVEADEGKIEQVLYNLLNNAFNHTDNGGRIVLRALPGEKKVRVEVEDTGPGIPEDEIKNIWERYYKSNKNSSRKRMGTGLGLAIVKSILEAHKSNFGVRSKVGEGTAFWFELKREKVA